MRDVYLVEINNNKFVAKTPKSQKGYKDMQQILKEWKGNFLS